MKAPALFKEYIWLVNTIYQASSISLAEINQRWVRTEMSEGISIARSTFNRHKEAIQEIFGIQIECDTKNGYKYYISNEEILSENSVQSWMISTLSVSNILADSLSLNNRIILEPTPSDGEYLQPIIEAMKQKLLITISYQKYTNDTPTSFTFAPYCIKMHSRRWYVLGHFHGEGEYFKTFSLDRIKSLEVTSIPFRIDPLFDANLYFKECFGIFNDQETPIQRVIIRAYGTQRLYQRDLPWHPSQQEVTQGEQFTDFAYYLRPTVDFRNHILSRGHFVKVLEPEWLAQEIKEMHLKAAGMY